MEKAEVIRLKEGERVDIIKHKIGYSIVGPVMIIVVEEGAVDEGATTPCGC